ncbi:DUF2953 domain-containing protein [Bacillus benzoevorans]|uniref:DUF2953 domain-containing protein n=1 Tax=Bacillus benzoevorans TaxID=1456 RepID=A0A7X0HU29_9BACI|nr:DUF2953 domain-containing protein [Bacillus benzoevorans]MBB6445715.1 hypothetical protein [Bacillus benzoevorans]
MKWVLLGCLLLILLFAIILMIKMKVSIHYKHAQDDDSLKIEFRVLFGLIKYRLNVPLIKVDDDSPSLVVENNLESGNGDKKKEETTKITEDDLLKRFHDFKALLEHVVSLHRIIRNFLKKVKITKLDWFTAIGTGDAALTGMLSGAVWTIKGSIIGLISHYFLLKNVPRVSVQPYFQMKVTQTVFTCMLQFRIGYAMFAAIKIIKFWKGGLPKFNKKPLSAVSQNKTNSI